VFGGMLNLAQLSCLLLFP